jgi:hypothetical protein
MYSIINEKLAGQSDDADKSKLENSINNLGY